MDKPQPYNSLPPLPLAALSYLANGWFSIQAGGHSGQSNDCDFGRGQDDPASRSKHASTSGSSTSVKGAEANRAGDDVIVTETNACDGGSGDDDDGCSAIPFMVDVRGSPTNGMLTSTESDKRIDSAASSTSTDFAPIEASLNNAAIYADADDEDDAFGGGGNPEGGEKFPEGQDMDDGEEWEELQRRGSQLKRKRGESADVPSWGFSADDCSDDADEDDDRERLDSGEFLGNDFG